MWYCAHASALGFTMYTVVPEREKATCRVGMNKGSEKQDLKFNTDFFNNGFKGIYLNTHNSYSTLYSGRIICIKIFNYFLASSDFCRLLRYHHHHIS